MQAGEFCRAISDKDEYSLRRGAVISEQRYSPSLDRSGNNRVCMLSVFVDVEKGK